jgi:hypothetical protein
VNTREQQREKQRGQGLVEFAMILPVLLLVVVSVAEIGIAFGNTHTVGYGSREGARVGSALGTGGVSDCDGGNDPSGVDAALVGAVQRILDSPGSGVNIESVKDIRIFQATSSGSPTSGRVNIWTHRPGAGPIIDPGTGERLDFDLFGGAGWPACVRDNSAATPDSIGVTVTYRYDFISPLPSVVNAIAGGDFFLTLTETTVMSLNPSI